MMCSVLLPFVECDLKEFHRFARFKRNVGDFSLALSAGYIVSPVGGNKSLNE